MAGITSICASGNHEDYSYNGPCSYYTYPNSFTDNLVIKVGGNDTTGGKVNFAQCGGFIDLIAPSTHDLYIVPDNTTNTYTDYLDPTDPTCPPSFINGTSFGTPHTTGVAALMQSYYYKNVPINIDPNIENILAPEDIEEMMQRNATDITFGTGATTGYDDPTGYGRLNAGAIFDSLTYPRFLIYHLKFDLPLSSVSMMAQEMTCLESIQDTNWNIPLGVTTVKRYKIDAIQNHTLPQGYSFIDGWARGSASKNIYGINSSNSTSNPCLELDPNLYNYTIPNASNPTMIHVTQNSVFLRGYIYELLDDNNNTVGWLPASPQDIATFAYSLYLVNETAGLDQNKVGSFSLFPNPSQSTVTLTFEQPQTANTKLWVADLNGRKVLSLPLNYLTEGSKSVTFDVSKFASGIYMVVLQNEKGTHTEKLVVE